MKDFKQHENPERDGRLFDQSGKVVGHVCGAPCFECVHLKHFEWCAERGIPRDPYSPSCTLFKGYGE